MIDGRAIDDTQRRTAIGMLPPQRQRLLIGQKGCEIDKGVVARLTRLDIATLTNKALDGGGAEGGAE